MSRPSLSPWEALDGPLLYLGRPVEGAFQIALLHSRTGTLAPLLTSERAGRPFLRKAPAGVVLLALSADDLRAKEEWLRAALSQGATIAAFDPDPLTLSAKAALPLDRALAYIISHRRQTACL